ncbi:MAG: helix-turn-helix domain-containing protein [Lachnospiraceae bacterium]|nr:helix-turn-helix domain-containing protein [Lachnospiraceae bacterium]
MEEQKKEKLIPLTAPLTVNCYTAKVYHVEDIQEILEISRTAAYALIKKAPFRVVHIGNAIRISKEDFDRWLNHSEQRNGGL